MFRNPKTGRLKEHFVFVVDNGPSEAPSNPLVKMWLVRLARFLRLKSVTQMSFAEYHSKRNFVERVHATHNQALSNEVFSSKAVHSNYKIGDERHQANMEHMAHEVQTCLGRTQFGGYSCVALRGIGMGGNFIFNDEQQLVNFLSKSERKKIEDPGSYAPQHSDLLQELATTWDLDENFLGYYRDDYEILQNSFEEEGKRTRWSDKYSTTILSPHIPADGGKTIFTSQPIPDYVRWFTTGGELHYLPLEKVLNLNTDVVDNTPGAFLPSKILEMAYKAFPHEVDTILSSIAFLSWCAESDVDTFFKEFKDKLEKSFQDDTETIGAKILCTSKTTKLH